MHSKSVFILILCCFSIANADVKHTTHKHIHFTIQSTKNGNWSNPKTWSVNRIPRQGDRVLIRRGHQVKYDMESKEVIRLIQVVGRLHFAQDQNTLLNVAVLKVQSSEDCSESGFACDFTHVNTQGEPQTQPKGPIPSLEIGTHDSPIPAKFTARIRLHFLNGMNKDDAPAIACCSARMDIHGAPMSRTWVKLGAEVKKGDSTITMSEKVEGWRIGDEVIITGSRHNGSNRTFRAGKRRAMEPETEVRTIVKIEGTTLTLNRPVEFPHFGTGSKRSEVANLSRNVIIESADPNGVRGHTVYHRYSKGSISYARFAHLGKEGVLGRYPIHFHLVGDTMRGSSVTGVSIVDSHNRWVTIHGTNYLVVRDCVGYQSVGHGYFMEDGTEVYNVFDRNLGVQAYLGTRLPKQVLPFDPNDGAAFWWANARNTIVRNVTCENDRYGYRYDSQKRSNFNSVLYVEMPDGKHQHIDIRKLPTFRFEQNEAHTEGLYGLAFAGTDGIGPDTKHPHQLTKLHLWEVHYALRAQVPTMLLEDVTIDRGVYGIYRPWFENHVYRNLRIIDTNTEPFNRGLDDRSTQHGSLTVDGLTFKKMRHGYVPMVQISANNESGKAETHLRNVKVIDRQDRNRRALINLGGGPRLTPKTKHGVPVYVHNWYGPGRHAKVVSVRAKDLLNDGNSYRKDEPLTGDESRVAEVTDVKFPNLLDPIDDHPPVTVILSVTRSNDNWLIRGLSHDNGDIATIQVNGQTAKVISTNAGLADWQVTISAPEDGKLHAFAIDKSNNEETVGHRVK